MTDPLLDPLLQPDRLRYHTGVLLDRDDFLAEQTYHRGRLARLARHLHGYGTVSGLRVAHEAETGGPGRIRVAAGLALDRFGRLIEVTEAACIRLGPWFDWHNANADRRSLLTTALKAADSADPDENGTGRPVGVVADVFLKFHDQERGRTPAFDTGAYDALDATVASRVRDAWTLELLPRTENAPGRPAPLLPDPAAIPAANRLRALRAAKLDAPLSVGRPATDSTAVNLEAEHAAGHHDGTELLLARLALPATTTAAGAVMPESGKNPWICNHIRRFCYSTADLAWLSASVTL